MVYIYTLDTNSKNIGCMQLYSDLEYSGAVNFPNEPNEKLGLLWGPTPFEFSVLVQTSTKAPVSNVSPWEN